MPAVVDVLVRVLEFGTNNPIKGARIRVCQDYFFKWTANAGDPAVRRLKGTTDAQGWFDMKGDGSDLTGAMYFIVTKPGYVPFMCRACIISKSTPAEYKFDLDGTKLLKKPAVHYIRFHPSEIYLVPLPPNPPGFTPVVGATPEPFVNLAVPSGPADNYDQQDLVYTEADLAHGVSSPQYPSFWGPEINAGLDPSGADAGNAGNIVGWQQGQPSPPPTLMAGSGPDQIVE